MESGKGEPPDSHTAIRYGRHRLDHPGPNLDRRKKGPHEAAQGETRRDKKARPIYGRRRQWFRGRRCRCAILSRPAGPRLTSVGGPVPTRSSDGRNACGWHEPKAGHRLTRRSLQLSAIYRLLATLPFTEVMR